MSIRSLLAATSRHRTAVADADPTEAGTPSPAPVVANTRWWPPFCMVVDWVVAAIIAVEIAAGMHFS